MQTGRATIGITLLALILLIITGCSAIPLTRTLKRETPNLPPILAQDEVLRPYVTLGRIKIVREVRFIDYGFEPNLREWGLRELQEEAARMSADAVIFPEITTRAVTIVVFPSTPATEYRATGVAIKFK